VYLVEGLASVPGDVFEDADRRINLTGEGGEHFVAGYLNLDERPEEVADIVWDALAFICFVFHRTRLLLL
jgi:hypothetical protein